MQVKELTYNELSITKSKFLTYLMPIHSLDEAKEYVDFYNKKHNDATHVCYAYILDENTFKYYDDGEPASTAGAPIYQTLKNNNLIYTLCVVIRYFGGTKLGVGGLIKAYTNSCLECLNKAQLTTYQILEEYILKTSYSNYDKLEYFLKTNSIQPTSKSFEDEVILKLSLTDYQFKLLTDSFQNHIEITKRSQ